MTQVEDLLQATEDNMINKLESPVSAIMNKVTDSLANSPSKNVYYLLPCFDLSPTNPSVLNTSPQSINTNILSK